jgi:hypothetical protein
MRRLPARIPKLGWAVLPILALGGCVPMAQKQETPVRELTIYYTAETAGYLEPCG